MQSELITNIMAVWTAIATWITSTLGELVEVFYVPETGLTFMGILAVAGLGMSVIFLVMGIIQGFLHFRG